MNEIVVAESKVDRNILVILECIKIGSPFSSPSSFIVCYKVHRGNEDVEINHFATIVDVSMAS